MKKEVRFETHFRKLGGSLFIHVPLFFCQKLKAKDGEMVEIVIIRRD